MTLTEYTLLDKKQQIKRFWCGMFIGQRLEGQSWIQCRQIDGFYVEYKILDKDSRNIRCFQNPDFLQPYLNKINIEALFS